ncbi:antitoxin Xre/MbcA/ParS toxin-binding domain-containing protein [Geobacter sp. DSM 9736]|uniref:antitoxin Xre/MbcA/ParS toxin-binding domain-containing protein n=1 Tax=Geobacter sp. DSM 9736 TaxID=1277350 RepID=UPI000B50A659|nr:antitoxin Xre/MbcA/ParS toxin-binding domain-containing protein [Geobacter sp. DSM 9736]SNB44617.1 Protein of unknown function [Geobacter sp. DSM 9736]
MPQARRKPGAEALGKAAVLSKALVRAAAQLDLPQAKLARILGVSAATMSRIYSGSYSLSPEKKEWEFAVLLVRLFRSLDAIVGGMTEDARLWLTSENRALADQKPLDLITTTEGLVRVVNYLDARRAVV